jgi:hypothetical protein
MHKGAVTVIGEDVLFGDKSGQITLISLADGHLLGQCKTAGSFSVTAPILVGKTLIVPTRDGTVWAAPYAELRARMVGSAGKCAAEPTHTAN